MDKTKYTIENTRPLIEEILEKRRSLQQKSDPNDLTQQLERNEMQNEEVEGKAAHESILHINKGHLKPEVTQASGSALSRKTSSILSGPKSIPKDSEMDHAAMISTGETTSRRKLLKGSIDQE